MKKTILSVLIVLSVSALLFACAPSSKYVVATTTAPIGIRPPTVDTGGDSTANENKVLYTENYSVSEGEYYYFFYNQLESFVTNYADRFEQLGFNSEISLREQSVKTDDPADSVTWYVFFRDITLEHMEEIILTCEAAAKVSSEYSIEASSYSTAVKAQINAEAKANNATFADYINLRYGGNVSTSAFLGALQKEYIYNSFREEKLTEINEGLTEEEVLAFVEADETYSDETKRDNTLSRNLAYALIDNGTENGQAVLDAFVAGEKSLSAFETAVEVAGYENGKVDNCTSESLNNDIIVNWLFAEDRVVGDTTLLYIEGEGHYIMYWYADGEVAYITDARIDLTVERFEEWIETLKAEHTPVVNEELLNALNA